MKARGFRAIALALVALFAATGVTAGPRPPVDRVAFAPPIDARLPNEARVVDERSHAGALRDYVRARPALVVPAYYGCSNLCTTVLSALATALSRGGVTVGRDVDVVVVSIDPLDTPASASAKKRAVLGDHDEDGWHFLTARTEAIDTIMQSLGYRYVYDETERQFAHAAGAAVVARDGRVVETLYRFEPEALRGAIAVAARDGDGFQQVGATPDSGSASTLGATPSDISGNAYSTARWLCFHYDPATGRYTLVAWNAVRVAAGISFAVLALYIIRVRLRERRASRTS
jgi:protein SCO1/2